MHKFVLQLEEPQSDAQAQGFIALDYNQWPFRTRRFQELGPLRGYGKVSRPVVDVFGSRFEVHALINNGHIPEGGELYLTETTQPLTPFEVIPELTEEMEAAIEAHYKDELSDSEKPAIKEYLRLTRSSTTFMFGQPRFIQGPVYPAYRGQAAFPFMCLETGWGDCGNVNIFVSVEKNKPVKAWLEASCA